MILSRASIRMAVYVACLTLAVTRQEFAQSQGTGERSAVLRSPRELSGEMAADQKAVNDMLGKENAVLKSAADRASIAPKLLPLLHRMTDDLSELTVAVPQLKVQAAGSQMQLMALRSALGDKEAADGIASLAASNDAATSLAGQAHQWMTRFYVTENSAQAKTELADGVEKFDRAHLDNPLLTQMTIEMGKEEGLPEIQNRMFELAAMMNNPTAAAFKEQRTAKKAAAAQDALVANKPLVISGMLPDGKAFSTASLNGKVVLIDFWATWCGPCVAELPRVKKIYADYHSKGLEVVGVSNDYDVQALKAFVINQNMPWPQLFDSKAAGEHEWNSITVGQKIDGIPVMYLIDKKGILRTVNARGNMEELIPQLLAE